MCLMLSSNFFDPKKIDLFGEFNQKMLWHQQSKVNKTIQAKALVLSIEQCSQQNDFV